MAILATLAVVVIISGLWGVSRIGSTSGSTTSEQSTNGKTAIVYKSPTCGCCGGYVSYLKRAGYDVEVKNEQDMASIKTRFGIPHDMSSCHTMIIDDYIVEGHVPMDAVEKLLTEKPSIDGIALPGMPSGSPGMPGPKRGLFTVYALNDSSSSEFTKL